jgi:hypothetical protein
VITDKSDVVALCSRARSDDDLPVCFLQDLQFEKRGRFAQFFVCHHLGSKIDPAFPHSNASISYEKDGNQCFSYVYDQLNLSDANSVAPEYVDAKVHYRQKISEMFSDASKAILLPSLGTISLVWNCSLILRF